jgi:hypothetical protein
MLHGKNPKSMGMQMAKYLHPMGIVGAGMSWEWLREQLPLMLASGRLCTCAPFAWVGMMRHGVDGFSPSSWELQEEGMMSTAASFSLSKKPKFVSPGKSQTPEGDAD